MGRLEGVEAARGMAALLVVLVHATGMLGAEKYLGELPLDGLFKFGHAGVDFFFVLSGFIIYFIHSAELGKPQFVGAFWAKRVIRIVPTYWVVLAGYGALLAVSPTPDRYEQDWTAVVTNIFLIPQAHGPILPVAWSLSHEFLFYAIFSIAFFSKPAARLVFIAWGALILTNVATGWLDTGTWSRFVFRIFNAEFFFGLLVAHAVIYWPIKRPGLALLLGGVLFPAAGVFESWGPKVPLEWPPLHLAYALGAAAMLYGLVGLERAGRLRMPGFAVRMGEASYSIYLLHVIAILFLQQALLLFKPFVALPVTATYFAVVTVAVLVGMKFSTTIEQPLLSSCHRLRKRLAYSA